ncbi:MAG: hypothetical protein ACTSVZ_07150, partial [Promethearchaeota archaeon]
MKKPQDGNRITSTELQKQLGINSAQYCLFFEHWDQIYLSSKLEQSYMGWKGQYPQLSSHISSESEKKELFSRTSYFIWILIQICTQV